MALKPCSDTHWAPACLSHIFSQMGLNAAHFQPDVSFVSPEDKLGLAGRNNLARPQKSKYCPAPESRRPPYVLNSPSIQGTGTGMLTGPEFRLDCTPSSRWMETAPAHTVAATSYCALCLALFGYNMLCVST